jgi:hypothetical protein
MAIFSTNQVVVRILILSANALRRIKSDLAFVAAPRYAENLSQARVTGAYQPRLSPLPFRSFLLPACRRTG